MRWLASPGGSALLGALPAYDPGSDLRIQRRLRAEGCTPEQTAALLLQSRLRTRAVDKLGGLARGMLFTPDGLEQASRAQVSAVHAERFAAASLATVHDLGCGIGADAMAMAALGVTVCGVDRDPVTAAVADVNLHPWPQSRARHGAAEDFVVPADPRRARVGVWFDPARRTPGLADVAGRTRRLFRLEDLSPSWSFVREVAGLVGAAGAKLSPSLSHAEVPGGCEAQWVSYGGTLVECSLWWGPLVRKRGRTALLLDRDGARAEVDESMADVTVPVLGSLTQVGAWLYEPDPAVTRAGLLGALTRVTGGGEVEAGLGYVVADRSVVVPYARRYAVTEAMPFHPKATRQWLRTRGVTGVTIKKRGIRADETQLRRDLGVGRGAGTGAQASLVLTRVAGRQVVLVVAPA